MLKLIVTLVLPPVFTWWRVMLCCFDGKQFYCVQYFMVFVYKILILFIIGGINLIILALVDTTRTKMYIFIDLEKQNIIWLHGAHQAEVTFFYGAQTSSLNSFFMPFLFKLVIITIIKVDETILQHTILSQFTFYAAY